MPTPSEPEPTGPDAPDGGGLARRVAQPVQAFLAMEAAGSIVLLAATVVAVAWATSGWAHGYGDLVEVRIPLRIGDVGRTDTLVHWVNDGLMAVFFFVVGLEIKREWVAGELRDRRAAATPAIAAVGGMVVPALIYLAVNAGGSGGHGWGTSIATDIAFALGVLRAFRGRIPRSLEVFLLTLAIVDDIGAIAVIAIFYSSILEWDWALAAVATVVLVVVLRRIGVRAQIPFVVLGVVLWWCTFESGIHATIAGVVMALLTPASLGHGGEVDTEHGEADAEPGEVDTSHIDRLEHLLHPWTTFAIVPLFALLNAGIDLAGPGFTNPTAVSVGIVLALVVGKFVGIAGGTWCAVGSGLGSAPAEARPSQLAAVACLGGIGFTVSIFVANLAFGSDLVLEQAKAGVLVASVVAACLGAGALVLTTRSPRRGQTAGMDAPETVTEATQLLRTEGYDADVQIVDGRLVWAGGEASCSVGEAEVHRLYRFEGDSDPGDEMVVFAVQDPSTGARGVLATAFGPAADPEVAEHLVGLSQRSREP